MVILVEKTAEPVVEDPATAKHQNLPKWKYSIWLSALADGSTDCHHNWNSVDSCTSWVDSEQSEAQRETRMSGFVASRYPSLPMMTFGDLQSMDSSRSS